MKIVNDIISLLDQYPENWRADENTLTWKCEGPPLVLWIANGRWFCQTWKSGYPAFPVFHRWRLWWAYQRWVRVKFLDVRLPNTCCSVGKKGDV